MSGDYRSAEGISGYYGNDPAIVLLAAENLGIAPAFRLNGVAWFTHADAVRILQEAAAMRDRTKAAAAAAGVRELQGVALDTAILLVAHAIKANAEG